MTTHDDCNHPDCISEEQAEAWVDAHFDRHPDGSATAPKQDPRIADRLERMAEGYFG